MSVAPDQRTRRLWVFNLDAEIELSRAGGGAYQTPLPVRRALATALPFARRLMAPGDVCLDDLETRGAVGLEHGFAGAAWCPTPSALRRLSRAGARLPPAPPLEVLRRVSHRRFYLELGGGAPGARFIADESELRETLAERDRPWLFKRPYGFSGRGQRRISPNPSQDDRRWLADGLRLGGLLAEPWLELGLELGLHGHIDANGRVSFGHACVQETNEYRAWVATRRATPLDLDAAGSAALRTRAEQVGAALVGAGYFGPFGVDAYLYQAEGRVQLNPLGELNARYTMGYAVGMGAA